MLSGKPLYAYAKLANNPTAKGKEEFREILTELVKELKPCKNLDSVIDGTLFALNKVRARLTEKDDRDFLDEITEQIIKLRK